MSETYLLRSAGLADAEAIAMLNTDSGRRTYRGMMFAQGDEGWGRLHRLDK